MNDWPIPEINAVHCNGCRLCVAYCPTGAVEMRNGNAAMVSPGYCAYCGTCENACEPGAISLNYNIMLPPTQGQNGKRLHSGD